MEDPELLCNFTNPITYKVYAVDTEASKVSEIEDLQRRDPKAIEQGEKDKKTIFHKARPKLIPSALHPHSHT